MTGYRWTDEEKEFLKQNFSRNGYNIPELLNQGRTFHSIHGMAREMGLKYCYKTVQMTNTLKIIIDGLVIGDGYIEQRKNTGRICITQSGKNKEWLYDISQKLEKNGIICHGIMTRKYNKQVIIFGKKRNAQQRYELRTSHYIELSQQRERWYPNGKKQIPRDIMLYPQMLTYWHMGDGSLLCQKHYNKQFYFIKLATHGFNKEDVLFLQDKLNKLYDYNFKSYKNITKTEKKNYVGWDLRLLRQEEVLDFLKLTEPYKINCFDHKWRALYTM